MTLPRALLGVLTVLGLVGVLVFGSYALVDYAALRHDYTTWIGAANSHNPSVQALLIAESRQNAHRINLFADGTWTLLAAVVAAIGLHAWCSRGSKQNPRI